MGKTIVVTGATGLVGRKLCLELLRRGHRLRVVTRNAEKARRDLGLPAQFHEWAPGRPFPASALPGAHALVHLAGEPIAASRWGKDVKELLRVSRVERTTELIQALKACPDGPRVVVGTSAVGFYGDRGDEVLDENTASGQGFLAELCQQWERAYQGLPPATRLVVLRLGVVLAPQGGALEKMLTPFRMGVGGKVGNGRQWMSWIHLDDVVGLYIHALENEEMSGTFNAVAPGAVDNAGFTRGLSQALGMLAPFPAPAFLLKALFGEMSVVMLASQRATAGKALEHGFSFQHAELPSALRDLLCHGELRGTHVFESCHWIPRLRDEVFAFFSQARNLEEITPPWLNFHVKRLPEGGIHQGALIDYDLRLKGLPLSWRTLISRWEPPLSFTDEQLKGPYSLWHHTHRFEEVEGGTLMTDRVVYRMPLGPLGEIARLAMVQRDVARIFAFRTGAIARRFGVLA